MKGNVAIGPDAGPAKEVHQKLQSEAIMRYVMACSWCDEEFDWVVASCGTGTTWSLYKCPHCKKFMAVGWAIPEAARTPDTKVIETEPIGPNASRKTDEKLPHMLWRTAKQLVSLLEKEYGFGKKDPPNRQITCAGCKGTFEVVDNRSGTVNEIVYCSACAKSRGVGQRQEVTASGQIVTISGETTTGL